MNLVEKTLSEEEKFSGRIFRVHVDKISLPNGETSVREVVEHRGGVCVAVLDAEDNVYLVRQFRYAYHQALLELPAGKLEEGEDPFEAMKREQREETGTISETYCSLGQLYPSPGYCSEIIHLWAGRICAYCAQDLDEDEFVEVVKMPLTQAVQWVLENKITDAKTQVGILKTAELLRTKQL